MSLVHSHNIMTNNICGKTQTQTQTMGKYDLDDQRYDIIIRELRKLSNLQSEIFSKQELIDIDNCEMTTDLMLRIDSLYEQEEQLQHQIQYLEYFLQLDYDEFVIANAKYGLISFCNGIPVVDYD